MGLSLRSGWVCGEMGAFIKCQWSKFSSWSSYALEDSSSMLESCLRWVLAAFLSYSSAYDMWLFYPYEYDSRPQLWYQCQGEFYQKYYYLLIQSRSSLYSQISIEVFTLEDCYPVLGFSYYLLALHKLVLAGCSYQSLSMINIYRDCCSSSTTRILSGQSILTSLSQMMESLRDYCWEWLLLVRQREVMRRVLRCWSWRGEEWNLCVLVCLPFLRAWQLSSCGW